MTEFSFECPVCAIGVNGRNLRRHTRRVHGVVTEPGIERFARQRMKEYLRDPKHWPKLRIVTWVQGTAGIASRIAKTASWVTFVTHSNASGVIPEGATP